MLSYGVHTNHLIPLNPPYKGGLEENFPPFLSYGVHTSLEILPETWFHRPSFKIMGINRASSRPKFGYLWGTKKLKPLRPILVCTP